MTAYRLAEEAQEIRPASINRVILCSDGDLNVGVRGDALLRMIEENRDRGVSLSVFGFGWGNYNDRDMEQMADLGNGNYAFIDREVEAERVLVKNISGTIMTIAKDAKIQVTINSERVERYRLLGYENRDIADDDFRNDAVDAGELGAGHTVTAFIELELKTDVPAADEVGLAKVVVRYQAGQTHSEAREQLQVVGLGQVLGHWQDASAAYRFGAAVAEFAEILRASEHSDGARFDDIIEIAGAAVDDTDIHQVEFLRLVESARDLWSGR
jgi:Ca-activated chloride channel family protein